MSYQNQNQNHPIRRTSTRIQRNISVQHNGAELDTYWLPIGPFQIRVKLMPSVILPSSLAGQNRIKPDEHRPVNRQLQAIKLDIRSSLHMDPNMRTLANSQHSPKSQFTRATSHQAWLPW